MSLNGTCPLHFAAQSGDVAEIDRLVASGIDVNVQDENGITPLKYASAEPHVRGIRRLLELGASATLADHRGFTPLHCAAGHGFYDEAVEIAGLLIDHGADVNARSIEHGFVPLHEVRGAAMIDFLLSKGADPTVRDAEGLTPLERLLEDQSDRVAAHLTEALAKR